MVDGTRSSTGKPLLANDPHLGLTAPSVWYLAHLSWPGQEIVGATFPGMPVVVLGHNGRVVWGFTNTGPDVQDLFVEKVDSSDPSRYLDPGGWRAFDLRRERIRVKDGEDVVLEVRESRHGPILNDAWTGPDQGSGAGQVFSLAWTALREDDLTLQAGLGLPHVRDWESFVDQCARLPLPAAEHHLRRRERQYRVPRHRPDSDSARPPSRAFRHDAAAGVGRKLRLAGIRALRSNVWCDDGGTAPVETCDEMLARALAVAVSRIARDHGDDPGAWRWGDAHVAIAEHRPFGKTLLAPLFNLSGAAPGSIYAINAFSFSPLEHERPFASTHGPGFRAVYDLADLDRSIFIHSTGQSGNILSPLYRSFEETWRDGEYVTIPTKRAAYESNPRGRLRLVPR